MKRNKFLYCTKRSVARRYWREGIIIPFYPSLVRPHMEYCDVTNFWAPSKIKSDELGKSAGESPKLSEAWSTCCVRGSRWKLAWSAQRRVVFGALNTSLSISMRRLWGRQTQTIHNDLWWEGKRHWTSDEKREGWSFKSRLIEHHSHNINFWVRVPWCLVWDSLSIVNQYSSLNKVLLTILWYPRGSTGTCNLNWMLFFLSFFKK